jgi:predicted nucleic acid-binding protein
VTSVVPPDVVVVDTDVFSHLYVAQKKSTERLQLQDRLVGRRPVIATQTRAELLAWPRLRGWGEKRARELTERVDAVRTLPTTDDVVAAYVDLQVACQRSGHALAQKLHTGDRWVAATAIALDRPLLSLDGIYRDAPGLATL